MAVPAAGNKLRAALQAKGWSYSRLAVELRRQAERDGVALPKHESLVTLITRWANNRQQPDGFYRDLLGRTLGGYRRVSCSATPHGRPTWRPGPSRGFWPAPWTPPRSGHPPSTCWRQRWPTSPAAIRAPRRPTYSARSGSITRTRFGCWQARSASRTVGACPRSLAYSPGWREASHST
jgi:hypothetical protein